MFLYRIKSTNFFYYIFHSLTHLSIIKRIPNKEVKKCILSILHLISSKIHNRENYK
jgi:hypothetical protein